MNTPILVQPGRMSVADVEAFITAESIDIADYTLNQNTQYRYDEFNNMPGIKFPYMIKDGVKVYFKHPALRADWDLTSEKITALFADSMGAFDQTLCGYFFPVAPAMAAAKVGKAKTVKK